jgi:hypothetical protein
VSEAEKKEESVADYAGRQVAQQAVTLNMEERSGKLAIRCRKQSRRAEGQSEQTSRASGSRALQQSKHSLSVSANVMQRRVSERKTRRNKDVNICTPSKRTDEWWIFVANVIEWTVNQLWSLPTTTRCTVARETADKNAALCRACAVAHPPSTHC